MSESSTMAEDLKAFERRLTEVVGYIQPSVLRWRLLLIFVSITEIFSAWFWLSDPRTAFLSLTDSLLQHPLFFVCSLTLIFLFCYGIHKLVIKPQIIISRTRIVLSEYNMSCDDNGKIILKTRPRLN